MHAVITSRYWFNRASRVERNPEAKSRFLASIRVSGYPKSVRHPFGNLRLNRRFERAWLVGLGFNPDFPRRKDKQINAALATQEMLAACSELP
jgi:hypothetical protein